jgi:hypothetical protein
MGKVLNTLEDVSRPEGRTMQDHGDRRLELHAAPKGGGEHRQARRRRTLKQARVVLSDWTNIDCQLRDVSEEGAHLVFGAAVSLPREFRLHNVSDRSIAPVKLEWQRGLEAGVTFTGPSGPLAPLKPRGGSVR